MQDADVEDLNLKDLLKKAIATGIIPPVDPRVLDDPFWREEKEGGKGCHGKYRKVK